VEEFIITTGITNGAENLVSKKTVLKNLVLKDTATADVRVLVQIFNDLFVDSESTELVIGADEPLYLPQSETGSLCQVISRLDYFSSALHEISHWCIAGKERRKLIDFGYWYEPDGRSEQQQRAFEQVEVKPQALEWLMTRACGMRFGLSVDNIAQPELGASQTFMKNVANQACRYIEDGLPERAEHFVEALINHYQNEGFCLESNEFTPDNLY
jgi:elongation factor P hydroxylase